MMYSTFDTGNFMVIPGSPAEAWEADNFVAMQKDHILRESMSSTSDNFLIVVVGSQFSYSGMLLEHALVLEALRPLLQKFPSSNSFYSLLKVHILGWNFTSAYKKALEVMVCISFSFFLLYNNSCLFWFLLDGHYCLKTKIFMFQNLFLSVIFLMKFSVVFTISGDC